MLDAVPPAARPSRSRLLPTAGAPLDGEPRLAAGRDGRPAFGLSVFLSARPDPVHEDLGDLVAWAFVSFDLCIASEGSAAPVGAGAFEATLCARRGTAPLVRSASDAAGRARLESPLEPRVARNLLATLAGDGAAGALFVRVAASTGRSWEIALDRLVRGRVASADLFYPDPAQPARFTALEPLVRATRSRGDGAEAHMIARELAAPTARALALTPDRRLSPSAHALLGSEVVQPVSAHTWAAADIVLDPIQGAILESFPVVDDPGAAIWPDRASSRRFYAPSFELRLPDPSDPVETSAFAFALTRTGTTADPGVPAMSATVRFTVDLARSGAVDAALAAAGSPQAVAVSLGNLSARLDVPFHDGATGELRVQSFVARTEATAASLTVTVDLMGECVRLVYGALSYAGFQKSSAGEPEPPRLVIAYAFTAYVPAAALPLRLACHDKVAAVPLVTGHAALPVVLRGPVLDVASATLHVRGAATALERERPRAAGRGPAQLATVHRLQPVAALPVAHAVAQPAPQPAVVAVAPLALSPVALAALRTPRYATRTIVREERVDVVLDCATYGALYVQNTDHGQVAIGCSDVLKLGQLEYRLYDEVHALAAATHRVFRSLRQPCRFLVAPATYRVTRYGPGEPEERRYRPVALIYALVGASPEESTYWFTATLEPDLPADVRAKLLADLAPLSPHGTAPVLEFPTDPGVDAEISYAWALPPGVEVPSVAALWNALQVSVSTGLHEGVVLKELIEHSGLRGAATFKLGDGLAFSAQLVLDTVVAGPWEGGPVPATLDGARALVKNQILQAVDVIAVQATRGGALQRVPFARRLAPGEEASVDLGSAADAAYAITAPPAPATLAELAVFEEDVATTVHFVNQVSLANHELSALSVRARIEGSACEYEASLEDLATASLEVAFPLTTHLQGQTLEYLLSATPVSGAVRRGPWLSWDLAAAGTVIGVTADQLP
jgi:hypothetical protein